MNYCEDCGCKIYSGKCTNCHEELCILDQYYEEGMKLPDPNSDFMKKVNKQKIDIADKKVWEWRKRLKSKWC
jgi:hypothetical protein